MVPYQYKNRFNAHHWLIDLSGMSGLFWSHCHDTKAGTGGFLRGAACADVGNSHTSSLSITSIHRFASFTHSATLHTPPRCFLLLLFALLFHLPTRYPPLNPLNDEFLAIAGQSYHCMKLPSPTFSRHHLWMMGGVSFGWEHRVIAAYLPSNWSFTTLQSCNARWLALMLFSVVLSQQETGNSLQRDCPVAATGVSSTSRAILQLF